MVSDQSKTTLGLEYFCNQGDDLWNTPDEELVELGRREVEILEIAKAEDVIDGVVFRVENTYPVYDSDYKEVLGTVREYLESLENFQTIGRNGLHRYNNQDHAMLTGMLAVRNIILGEQNNLWVVNAEQEYHEEVREVELERIEHVVEEAFAQAFMKLDSGAFGIALGLTSGLALFFTTLMVALNGRVEVIQKMLLLDQYLPGYEITVSGSVLGLVYGFMIGFFVGWWFAFLRNAVVLLDMALIQRRAQFQLMRKLLDF